MDLTLTNARPTAPARSAQRANPPAAVPLRGGDSRSGTCCSVADEHPWTQAPRGAGTSALHWPPCPLDPTFLAWWQIPLPHRRVTRHHSPVTVG